ncbi:MAG: MarC family protein [Chloroflexota bacterium]|nr:MarC family protein [Chloroflexota bacterium]
MNLGDIDLWVIFDIFVLLLIGMGPKIALVPFLELTSDLDRATRKKVANRMVRTGVTVALILVVLGAFLMKLLHFSEGALYIAGGIVFLLLALKMLTGGGDDEDHHEKASERSAMQMALYPLAVPYLLNPAGITMLVIFSGAIDSWIMMAILVGLVLLMGAFDWLIFKNLDSLAEHLDPSRLAVTEAIFGVLLSALAIQLILDGLNVLGIIAVNNLH